MRYILIFLCVFTVFGCRQKGYDKVWSTYDWLPAGAESSNAYSIPNNAYRGYGGGYSTQPVYDNDSDYMQPRGFGICNSGNYLACE